MVVLPTSHASQKSARGLLEFFHECVAEQSVFQSHSPHFTISYLQYKLCKIRRVAVGPKGVPYATTHDARTIRYPDPLIKANDTVQVDIATGKIKDFIKFDSGVLMMFLVLTNWVSKEHFYHVFEYLTDIRLITSSGSHLTWKTFKNDSTRKNLEKSWNFVSFNRISLKMI